MTLAAESSRLAFEFSQKSSLPACQGQSGMSPMPGVLQLVFGREKTGQIKTAEAGSMGSEHPDPKPARGVLTTFHF
jgi:hypothetical protein